MAASHALSGDDLRTTACHVGDAPAPIIFDRGASIVRTRRPVAEGDYLGAIAVPPHAFPDTGDALTLTSRLGAASVTRAVTALLPAPHGGAVFVEDGDGDVFSAPLGASPP
jgi:hypothetical protein